MRRNSGSHRQFLGIPYSNRPLFAELNISQGCEELLLGEVPTELHRGGVASSDLKGFALLCIRLLTKRGRPFSTTAPLVAQALQGLLCSDCFAWTWWRWWDEWGLAHGSGLGVVGAFGVLLGLALVADDGVEEGHERWQQLGFV
jgi:hypothetical protein